MRNLVVLAGIVLAAAPAPQQTFRLTAEGVLVDVAVHQGNRPVAGLTADDFELLDNGVVQQVQSSALTDIPIDVTLLLDSSASVDGRLLERLKAAVRDTARWLRTTDRVRVVAMQHLVFEVVPMQPGGADPPLDSFGAAGGTALFDGLMAAMMRSAEAGRRQLVVAYTDGDDVSSIMTPLSAMEMALSADAVVHAVVPLLGLARGVPTGGPARNSATSIQAPEILAQADARTLAAGATRDTFPNQSALGEITARTGGRLFVVGFDESIGGTFRRVLQDFRTSYLLQYVPQGVDRGGWHEITVRVKREGRHTVRARRGYTAGG